MAFQQTVNIELGLGVPGEMYTDAPHRAWPAMLNSASAAYNVFGSAFTVVSGDPGDGSGSAVVQAGGTGIFAGLMSCPKENPSYGTAGAPLASNITLPNNNLASFMPMGTMVVQVPGACNIGDSLTYNTTTGVLGTLPPAITGFTVTQSAGVITVAGAPSSANIGVGSVITIPGYAPSTVVSLGTGTGGNGTYNVNTSQTIGTATASTATPVAPTGYVIIKRSQIVRYTPSAAGLAVATLTEA